MQEMNTIEVMSVDGCVIKDEAGMVLATLKENEGRVEVIRSPRCSLGLYFYILSYLRDLGYETSL